MIAGIVAAVLNLILPQEDAKVEDDEPVPSVEIVDVEAHAPRDVKKE